MSGGNNIVDTNLEGESEHYRLVPLDQPCQHCKALELDDAGQGGTIKHKRNGKRFVDFGEVQETYGERSGRSWATRAMWAGSGKTPDKLATWPKIELKLGYKRDDTLPDLPGLTETAAQGCGFCKMLRKDVLATWDTIRKRGGEVAADEEMARRAKLTITEITYQFRTFSPDNEEEKEVETETEEKAQAKTEAEDEETVRRRDEQVYLDALYVFFTVGWDSGSRDYSLYYNFYADANDPCVPWFQIRCQPVAIDHLSPPSIKRIQALIEKSLLEIPASNKAGEDAYFPTRILDVGSSTSTDLRLVVPADHPAQFKGGANPEENRYAALSYCWGPKDEADKQLKTTRSTIQDRMARIEFGHLPPTVADAVQVCRKLGIRYLWVDALCIVQDDGDDWAREAFEMANVYANSFLTLCILQGASCTSGFLNRPLASETLQVNFRSTLDNSVAGKLYLRMLQSPDKTLIQSDALGGKLVTISPDKPAELDLSSAPWNERGWTFQEAQLSPRKLFFGPHMFHISCGKLHESADGSTFDDPGSFAQGELEDVLNHWYHLVTQYGRRALSFEKDRFPALSAFARTISDRFPDQEYLAGVWKSDLHRGLLWTSYAWTDLKSYLERPADHEYVAPSWSWADRPRGIIWFHGVGSSIWPHSPEFELKNANIVTEALNPFGRVLSGSLELDAKLFQFPLSRGQGKVIKTPDNEGRWLQINFHYTLLSENDEYIASLHLDWLTYGKEEFPDDPLDQLWMILISRSTLDPLRNQWNPFKDKLVTDPEIMVGLLLLPTTSGKENEFIKVGVWYSDTRGLGGSKFWDDIPRQSVTLV